jgi:hypothetical protein
MVAWDRQVLQKQIRVGMINVEEGAVMEMLFASLDFLAVDSRPVV